MPCIFMFIVLDAFSAKTAFLFLDKLQQRIVFVSKNPEIGIASCKKINVRSVILQPHNKIYYRLQGNKVYFLTIIDMRRDIAKDPF